MPKVPLGRRVLPELPDLPDHLVPLDRLAQSGPQDQKAIQVPRQNPNSKTLGMGPPQLAAPPSVSPPPHGFSSLSFGRQGASPRCRYLGPCVRRGKPLRPSAVSSDWSELAERIGMPEVTFHALRHTHASQLIAHGVDIVTISKRLGHAKPSVTLAVYAHMFTSDDRKAAAAINAALNS